MKERDLSGIILRNTYKPMRGSYVPQTPDEAQAYNRYLESIGRVPQPPENDNTPDWMRPEFHEELRRPTLGMEEKRAERTRPAHASIIGARVQSRRTA